MDGKSSAEPGPLQSEVDTKVIGEPDTFDGTEAKFGNWKIVILTYLWW